MVVSFSDIGLSRQLFFDRIREPESTRFLISQLEDGMTVLDVGANIGYYTLIAARNIKGGIIYAVEPDPRCVELLKRNVTLNNLTDRVELHAIAFGDKVGTAKFLRSVAFNVSRIPGEDEELDHNAVVDVPMVTLDDFLKDKGCDVNLIKCDAEGYEYFIVKGGEKTLRSAKRLKIFMEIHPGSIKRLGGNVSEMLEIMSDFNVKALVTMSPPAFRDIINPFRGYSLSYEKVIKYDSKLSELMKDENTMERLQGPYYRIFLEKGF